MITKQIFVLFEINNITNVLNCSAATENHIVAACGPAVGTTQNKSVKLGRPKVKNAICSSCSGNALVLFASSVFAVVLNSCSLIANDGDEHKILLKNLDNPKSQLLLPSSMQVY